MVNAADKAVSSEEVMYFFARQLFADNLITADCVVYLKKKIKEDADNDSSK